MYGRSVGEVGQPCIQLTFGLPLAPIWGSGMGLISGPFRRRFRDSFSSSFGASKVSRKVARRYTESQKIPESSKKAYGILADPSPNLESFRCTLLRLFDGCVCGNGIQRIQKNKKRHTENLACCAPAIRRFREETHHKASHAVEH